MINFHIPGFVLQHELNLHLLELMKNRKYYFYEDIKISAIYGAFPPSLWNGGRSFYGNIKNEDQRKELIELYNSYGVGVIFTFTNVSLNEIHYNDYLCMSDIKSMLPYKDINKIVIADETLKEVITNKFGDDLKFILSTTSDVVLDKDLNELKEKESEYDLIVPNYNFNNNAKLFKIDNPSKYEILVNPNCAANCKFEKEHYKNMSDLNLDTVAPDEVFKCPFAANEDSTLEFLMKNKKFITVEDLYGKYKEAGFNTFKINGRTVSSKDLLDYYLYYLIKSEYKEEVYNSFKDNNLIETEEVSEELNENSN